MNYFAWFLLFLLVPIIVHLFNFRRAKKLLFTNVKFIRKISSETKSKTRLKHLLILGSRILIFVFLTLAFLFSLIDFNSKDQSSAVSFGSFYLDNSFSSIGDELIEEKSYLDRLISSRKSNEGYFITNDFSEYSTNKRTKGEVIQKLNEVKVSSLSRPLGDVLDRFNNTDPIYLVSDFQQGNESDFQRIKSDSLRNYYLIVSESSRLNNAYVDSVWLERSLEDYSNILINCRLGYSIGFNEGSVVVKLVNENGSQVSSIVLNIQSERHVSFSLPQDFTETRFKILLSGDEVEYDNEFYLSIEPLQIPSVLIISQRTNTYLSNVFGNQDLFLTTISSDIDYELLSQMDLVVLNGFSRIPDGLISQNSNTFFLIPQDSIDFENYQNETGLRWAPSSYNSEREVQMVRGNELINGVYQKIDESSEFPLVKNSFDIRSPHEAILSLRGGPTYLGKSTGSNLYFLSTPLVDDLTTFPNHSIFLPVMYRIADTSVDRLEDLVTYPNTLIEISKFNPEHPPKIVSSEIELIPEFFLRGDDAVITVPGQLLPGFYYVIQNEDTVRNFSLNLPKAESISSGLTFHEMVEYFDDSDNVEVISMQDEQSKEVLATLDSNSIWKYALILTLFFLTLETAFHRYLK